VEAAGVNLKLDEFVNIYRSEEYAGKSSIGSGKTKRNTNAAITAEGGSVYMVHAEQGDAVKRGDLLVELVTGTIPMREIPENEVKAEMSGVVASVDAAAGATVSKDQLLVTLYPFDDFQVAVLISENDLPYVEIGDAVRIELAGAWEKATFSGTVASISGLGSPDSSGGGETATANYTVYIDFVFNENVRQGMNVEVYFNGE